MYNVVSVGKLSETQKSKLRNGHPTRIIKGSANKLHLTNEQLKKFEAAARKGKAYTVTLNPEQAAKHGQGIFGDIHSKVKKLAIKHKDVLNPIIAGLKTGAKKGASKLAETAQEKLLEYALKAQDKIDSNINPIEGGAIKRRGRPKKGEGLIGDALKGLITMSGVGAKPRKPRAKKGKGIGALLGPLVKLAAPMVIDAVAGAAKGKVSGMGISATRPTANEISDTRARANEIREARFQSKGASKVIDGTGKKRKAGRPRKRRGGALMPA